MKALVTGSNGFVGRHMANALKVRGYEVIEWDLPETDMLVELNRISTPSVDLVVHCAYRVGGRKEINSSRVNLSYNLSLDVALFQWAMKKKPGRILYFSSSAIYPVNFQGPHASRRLAEGMAGEGSPDADYGWAKATGERLARNYAASGGIVHVVRPFSGYGEDQSEDYPFPKFIARAKAKQNPFEIWGDPSSERDWIHIDDVVAASLAVVDADYRDPVNICTGIGTAMWWLARLCMWEAGYEADHLGIQGPIGVHTRVGEAKKLSQIYTPKISIEEGIKRAFS
jgi:nucleoside-diphosphate-sugar epimerase